MDESYQIVFVIILYIISIFLNRMIKGKQDREMQELAARLSLEYAAGGMMGGPKLTGRYGNSDVMVENVVRSHGREKKVYFRVSMFFEIPFPDSIRVHNAVSFKPVAGLLGEIGDLFGVRDIQFDNSVFNEKFVIRGMNDAVVKAVIDPAVQESLLSLTHVNLIVQNGEIIYEAEGSAPENENSIRTILELEQDILGNIKQIAASSGFETLKEKDQDETPRDTFASKTRPVKPAPKPQTMYSSTSPGGHVIVAPRAADITPLKSDYRPEPISPSDVISRLKREGYYTGD